MLEAMVRVIMGHFARSITPDIFQVPPYSLFLARYMPIVDTAASLPVFLFCQPLKRKNSLVTLQCSSLFHRRKLKKFQIVRIIPHFSFLLAAGCLRNQQ